MNVPEKAGVAPIAANSDGVDKGKEEESQSLEKGKQPLNTNIHGGDDSGNHGNGNGICGGVGSGNFVAYPKAMAKYEDVIADPKLFMSAIEKLHALMRTKFMVPIIGGRELDLHRLFKEVTSRGGINKVKSDNRWREVTASFNFPSTATNASFVLRKYYMSLLHHFEQIYFFGAHGWYQAENGVEATSSVASQSEAQKRKRSNTSSSTDPSSSLAYPRVVGVIDGKFESGYLVTATVGSQVLKGVLFLCPQQSTLQQPLVNPVTADNCNTRPGRRRRRKRLSKRDPTHPKPNRSGYNFFFAEQHARLKPLHPGKDREISRMIGELWNNLTEVEKAVYQEKGFMDKERYKSEMVVYREKQQTGQPISSALPIQQQFSEHHEVTINDVDAKVEEGDIMLANQDESSSDETDDSGEKSTGEDSDSEICIEASPGVTDSMGMMDPLTDGNGFELRRRENVQQKDERDIPGFIQDEIKKVPGVSNDSNS